MYVLSGTVVTICSIWNFVSDWTDAEKKHLSQELSDVLLYLIRLSEACNIGEYFSMFEFVNRRCL